MAENHSFHTNYSGILQRQIKEKKNQRIRHSYCKADMITTLQVHGQTGRYDHRITSSWSNWQV
jgi:hypothetical protein